MAAAVMAFATANSAVRAVAVCLGLATGPPPRTQPAACCGIESRVAGVCTGRGQGRWGGDGAVSYTHLTLPTICSV
eukprot:1136012-Alexandrium_andersonii.AAC.2